MPLFHCVYLILFGLLVTRTFSKTIKVLTTEEDLSKFKDGSGARLKNPPNIHLVDLTICLRFYDFVLVDKFLVHSRDENGHFIRGTRSSRPMAAMRDY